MAQADDHITEGDGLLRRGDLAGAERCYRLALEADPRSASALQSLGYLAMQRGDLQAGVQWARRAVEAAPGFALAYNLLGSALLALGRYEEALAALPKGPTDSRRAREGMAFHLGLCCAGLGRWREAEAHLRAALDGDPTYQTRYLPVGMIAHDPFHADVHLVLAQVLLRRGNHEEAKLHDRLARRMDPGVALTPVAEAALRGVDDLNRGGV